MRWIALVALALASLLWILYEAELFERGARGVRNLGVFLADMTPPAYRDGIIPTLAASLWLTVKMAWAGTLLGALVALPCAALAASNLAPWWLAYPVRSFLAAIRTIPSILWAVFMVIVMGLGPLAGILALAAYTTGYLGKLFYEALEAVDPEALDAARATGASRLQVARHAALPEAGNALLSQSLFAFEYNVRASSILGLVGAGGIGFYLLRSIELFQYRTLATALIMLFLLVIAVDGASRLVRKRFLSAR